MCDSSCLLVEVLVRVEGPVKLGRYEQEPSTDAGGHRLGNGQRALGELGTVERYDEGLHIHDALTGDVSARVHAVQVWKPPSRLRALKPNSWSSAVAVCPRWPTSQYTTKGPAPS